MSSALEHLTGPGKPLSREPFDAREFAGMLRTANMRLRDASHPELSVEGRFDLAYNAAHAFCLAALRRMGYRSNHRYIVFQVLPHTLALGPEVWRVLAKAHERRNLGEYEGVVDVDERFVADVIAACAVVADAINRFPESATRDGA